MGILIVVIGILFLPMAIESAKQIMAEIKADKEAEALEKKVLIYIEKFLPRETLKYSKNKINGFVPGEGAERLKSLMDLAFNAACERCIREHAKILTRKRNSSIYKDDYGNVIKGKWNNEIIYFVETVLIPFVKSEDKRYPDLRIDEADFYKAYIKLYERRDSLRHYAIKIDFVLDSLGNEEANDISLLLPAGGHDYERYVAAIFEHHGYSARVTKGSGDHGADIVVDWGEGEVVVQCKHYSSPVGNKAVQEVYSAKGFYGADQAWVVASSSFTPAAKIAAERLGVLLLHHEDLPGMLEAIDSGNV